MNLRGFAIDIDYESEVRKSAFSWLDGITDFGKHLVNQSQLRSFAFDGLQISLLNSQGGICKPRTFAAALSIRTGHTPADKDPLYEDKIGEDGFLRYKYMNGGAEAWGNVALRTAFELGLPLIWFFTIKPGQYLPIYPVQIISDEPSKSEITVQIGEITTYNSTVTSSGLILKSHREQLVKIRVHQPIFRERVLSAYETKCAVCQLRHSELLDAAHIIPDSRIDGLAIVPNGLALCKIHHAAFDRNFIGIQPDLTIKVRSDLLLEKDGPMLLHGIQELNDQKIHIPKHKPSRPDEKRLERRFNEFLNAS